MVAELIDLDALDAQLGNVMHEFSCDGVDVLHAYAVKANPLRAVMERVKAAGLGAECASAEEVRHALAVGFPPADVMYDSPCKTRSELLEIIKAGCTVNLDNRDELKMVRELIETGELPNPPCARIGLRVNPAVGEGAIKESSTAGLHGKFGEQLLPSTAQQLIELFREHAWITGVHCHVGSQGCPQELLCSGAKAIYDFAEKVNTALGKRQVTWLDIGGGVNVCYRTSEPHGAGGGFAAYRKETVPGMFSGDYKLITEFGRSIVCKCGVTVSAVATVKDCGGIATAIIHTGANQLLREVYLPGKWFHRMTVYDSAGKLKRQAQLERLSVAGPLCFGGDFIARQLPLPPVAAGDFLCVHDTGAYCSSMYSMFNSRTPPPVFGYRRACDGRVTIQLLKEYKGNDVLAFWE